VMLRDRMHNNALSSLESARTYLDFRDSPTQPRITFSIKVNTFMGRPPGRAQHRPFQMRASDNFLRSVDNWRRKQEDRPSRAEAIRRLVEQALAFTSDDTPTSKQKSQKASDLADRAAEQIADKSMPPEEQQRRKRAMIKGPQEFREIRERSAKGKG
jgi:hypothetical protein